MASTNLIADVKIIPLHRIPDDRGMVMHMLRSDDPHFLKLGEIYFSMVYPGAVKGWHLHTLMSLNYTVVVGNILLVIYDDRKESPSSGVVQEIFLGEDQYSLVQIPPNLWNAFKGLGNERSIVANCSTHPHDLREIKCVDAYQNHIPYRWNP